MTESPRLEPLGYHHIIDRFDCGNDDLTDWLVQHSGHATRQGTRTYVLIREGTQEALGYVAIAPHLLEREELPTRVGRGAPRQVPAILLAKLALDVRLHGQGLGSELLVRTLHLIAEAARVAGGKLVVVDAIDDDAAAFYGRHDFVPVPGNPHRLIHKLSTVAKALDLDWPGPDLGSRASGGRRGGGRRGRRRGAWWRG